MPDIEKFETNIDVDELYLPVNNFDTVEFEWASEEITRSREIDLGLTITNIVTCGRFVNAGNLRPNEVNIENTCNRRLMFTVQWQNNKVGVYRLPRNRGRLIRKLTARGQLVKEEPWNFLSGDDFSNRCRIEPKEVRGGKLYEIVNPTRRYVCFEVDIKDRGRPYAIATGIVNPLDRTRVASEIDDFGEVFTVRIISARADTA